ncbi:hypothetical protein HHK36_020455 [Tetracentron sinense]|uniref:Kinesin motor domain-containing protein n=1 Tax=Tetracentron sinense TaxID=13715 RepID=A0A835D813_TETSI|nr:hypothetical protein HHK36_020455 [Tetracentron sinense]
MAPTPSKSVQAQATPSKTPQSKHRQHFNTLKNTHPSPNPNSTAKETPQIEHPVEVIGRIRDYPDRKEKPISALHITLDRQTIRVRTDIGYRDFSLDGVSLSEEEDLDGFYKKFVESRINDVKLGAKCTIMTYGPTGSGKSHTMFGCPKQPGIVYRALRDILGEGDGENETDCRSVGLGSFVQVTVLEIYNEEIYDLLSSNNGGGLSFGWPKGNASKVIFSPVMDIYCIKLQSGQCIPCTYFVYFVDAMMLFLVRLEVMGKKAKNATFISGNEAGKISREVQKVEKRRIVKSTHCNDRSSRSHCMIILDVPSVGGRLMLVDMAGSENIEQAGQIGFEAKMQVEFRCTAKINQGNIALKRVVESIANGDSHVPFRDSKLTMLLQDSFEDDRSKILMILCASPDPKEMHKTISTLEYGAKAKCIVRGSHTPTKDKIGAEDSSSTLVLGSRIAAMDQFIYKLQMENKLREKESNEAHKKLLRKEQEVAALRAKLEVMEEKGSGAVSEEEINLKVNERTQFLKLELEKKLQECQQMANEFVELGRRRMEEKILQQQEEVEMLRRRLEEIESELCRSRDNNGENNRLQHTDGSSFARRLLEIYADGDQGMEKSMDLVKSMDLQPVLRDVKEMDTGACLSDDFGNTTVPNPCWGATEDEDGDEIDVVPKFAEKLCLSTVFEEEEGEESSNTEDEEVEKEIVEDTRVPSRRFDGSVPGINLNMDTLVASQNLVVTPNAYSRDLEKVNHIRDRSEEHVDLEQLGELENAKDPTSARRTRIQNIFMLCGNHRELGQHVRIPTPTKKRSETFSEESAMNSLSKEISQLQTIPVPELGLNNRTLSDVTERNITQTSPLVPHKLANEHKLIEHQLNKNRAFYETALESKENNKPGNEKMADMIEVYVKWEASKENSGKCVTKLKVVKDSTLADLRKLIEIHLGEEKQAFTFLMLGDPTGAPVSKEKEGTVQANKLPIFNNQLSGHLACLRPVKGIQRPSHLPFSSLENKLPINSNSPFKQKVDHGFSTKVGQNFSATPYHI